MAGATSRCRSEMEQPYPRDLRRPAGQSGGALAVRRDGAAAGGGHRQQPGQQPGCTSMAQQQGLTLPVPEAAHRQARLQLLIADGGHALRYPDFRAGYATPCRSRALPKWPSTKKPGKGPACRGRRGQATRWYWVLQEDTADWMRSSSLPLLAMSDSEITPTRLLLSRRPARSNAAPAAPACGRHVGDVVVLEVVQHQTGHAVLHRRVRTLRSTGGSPGPGGGDAHQAVVLRDRQHAPHGGHHFGGVFRWHRYSGCGGSLITSCTFIAITPSIATALLQCSPAPNLPAPECSITNGAAWANPLKRLLIITLFMRGAYMGRSNRTGPRRPAAVLLRSPGFRRLQAVGPLVPGGGIGRVCALESGLRTGVKQ